MLFEWDDKKNEINLQIHGIDFETASRVFGDPNRIERYDKAHSLYEDRYITIGSIDNAMYVIMVVYTVREDAIWLISARFATEKEKRTYYEYS